LVTRILGKEPKTKDGALLPNFKGTFRHNFKGFQGEAKFPLTLTGFSIGALRIGLSKGFLGRIRKELGLLIGFGKNPFGENPLCWVLWANSKGLPLI